MNLLLWAFQALLAGIYFRDGILKILEPARMRAQGLNDVWLLFFIGFCEVFGSLGLVLPPLFRVLPWLTPLAALGIAAIMALAARFHLKRREARQVALTLSLMSLSLFLALGRTFISPLS